jgi:hypothetical protein
MPAAPHVIFSVFFLAHGKQAAKSRTWKSTSGFAMN